MPRPWCGIPDLWECAHYGVRSSGVLCYQSSVFTVLILNDFQNDYVQYRFAISPCVGLTFSADELLLLPDW